MGALTLRARQRRVTHVRLRLGPGRRHRNRCHPARRHGEVWQHRCQTSHEQSCWGRCPPALRQCPTPAPRWTRRSGRKSRCSLHAVQQHCYHQQRHLLLLLHVESQLLYMRVAWAYGWCHPRQVRAVRWRQLRCRCPLHDCWCSGVHLQTGDSFCALHCRKWCAQARAGQQCAVLSLLLPALLYIVALLCAVLQPPLPPPQTCHMYLPPAVSKLQTSPDALSSCV